MPDKKPIDNRTLNRLRAAVLGANDGIVSTSSVVMGVAGAGAANATIFTAGLAALVAGALSMAVGEYVSVGSQLDAERTNAEEHDEDMEFTSPIQAALASFLFFSAGGLVPFLAIIFAPENIQIIATIIAVFIALILTGYFSARVSRTPLARPLFRVVIGGMLAMAVTYYVGTLFGVTA